MSAMSVSVFLRLVQRRRIRDPLAALLTREGINDEVGGTDQPGFHCRGRLNRYELIHKHFVDPAPKLTQRLGQHEGRLLP